MSSEFHGIPEIQEMSGLTLGVHLQRRPQKSMEARTTEKFLEIFLEIDLILRLEVSAKFPPFALKFDFVGTKKKKRFFFFQFFFFPSTNNQQCHFL